MSLSQKFSRAVLAIGTAFFQCANASPIPHMSTADEIRFTKKLGKKLPVVTSIIEFQALPEMPDIDNAFYDPDVRRLAYEMSEDYKKRCGDPLQRNDICHLRRADMYNVLTYSFHIDFNDKALTLLANKVTHKYSAERMYMAYRANCYSYAVGDYFLNGIGGADVGRATYGIKPIHLKNAQEVVDVAVQDGLQYAGNDPQILDIPKGKRVILLYVREENGTFRDYHWTRIDRRKNGSVTLAQKMSINKSSSIHPVENIYDEMRETFTNEGEGYKFVGFFYVPIEGLDVGVDAYGRRHGIVPPLKGKLDKIPTQHEMDVTDFNALKVLMSDERTPN